MLVDPIAGQWAAIHLPPKSGDNGILNIPAGSTVIVEADDNAPKVEKGFEVFTSFDSDNSEQVLTDQEFDRRDVRVTVLTGEGAGAVGSAYRYTLRPLASD
ncbi:MAG TPA: hypothetical protein VFT74_11720 [Isosphaeraceae bacterium]|nr:hypothetical protein [Isosphaeraceae bacterium]